MAFLLDTNHCIYALNGWKKPESKRTPEESRVVKKIRSLEEDTGLYLCEASLGELYYGAECSQKRAYNLQRIDTLKTAIIPISVNEHAWRLFGRLKATLRREGKKIPDIDLLIATTAEEYKLSLVTNDTHLELLPKNFKRVNWANN